MNANNDDYKSILGEAGLSEDSDELSSLLKDLSNQPHRYGRVEPPAGYETHLLAALKTRLPLAAKSPPVMEVSAKVSFWNFFATARVAWSFSGAMAIFVAVLALQSIRHVETLASSDFLTQTAQRGSSEAVERWVASVADIGVRMQDTNQGALVEELSKADPVAATEALESVAKSLGMRNGI